MYLLAGNGLVMLSSTSLLHGNCVFNRNNTVATQQGMKTYWLCKSYRISMCRARCITHQGRVISATGVHNHPPHMRSNNSATGGGTGMAAANISAVSGPNYSLEPITSSGVASQTNNASGLLLQGVRSSSLYQQTHTHPPTHHPHHHHHHQQQLLMQQQHQQQQQPQNNNNNNNGNETLASAHHLHHNHHHNTLPLHHQHQHMHNGVIQNVMHLPNISMLPPPVHLQQHQQHQHAINSPLLDEQQQQQQQQHEDVLEITPLLSKSKSPIVANESLTPVGGEQMQLTTSSEHELMVPLSPNSRAASVDLNGTPNQAQELTTSDDSTHHQQQQQHHHQAHVIDSITISPNARHNFKLEQM